MDVTINYEEFDEDDLIPLELLEFSIPRRIYERQEYFRAMERSKFRKRFRVPKHTVLTVLEEIRDKLEVPLHFTHCDAQALFYIFMVLSALIPSSSER
ncbi:unnamed protein product [Acanthoscelides obtectus]|uniref:Uncharacterized protein n=1 Tax=Acanthoscelides obtectus TaxID=200917 RepID=A0A9P0LGM8_ACAOB|nr:unnamed protein product [Acanthoscelides obtectus]CAK1620788.1 hypothetical protein AOBTE_LOCUS572 [Acanthoscelides obtectus]